MVKKLAESTEKDLQGLDECGILAELLRKRATELEYGKCVVHLEGKIHNGRLADIQLLKNDWLPSIRITS